MFQKPYSTNNSMSHTMKSAMLISLFLILFFIAFKPFGLNNIPRSERFVVAFIYGGLNFITVIIVQALLWLILPKFMIEDTWTIGKEVLKYLLLFFCITLVFVLFNGWYLDQTIQPINFISVFINVLLLAFLPVVGVIGYHYNNKLKLRLAEAQQLNQQINNISPDTNETQSPELIDQAERIMIQSDNQSESFELFPDDFLYAESASNYIDVFYLEDGHKSKKTIRSSLKKMEQTHNGLKQFSRCHRTHIVNLNKVASFEGNSRGYTITLIDELGSIPVSRGYIEKIKKSIGEI